MVSYHPTNMTSTPDNLPKHIALVMDGNGRWATKRFLPRAAGHKKGLESLRRCIKHSIIRGVTTLSVFAFSSENWQRPADEVGMLFDLLLKVLSKEIAQFHEAGVKIVFLGEINALAPTIRQAIADAENITRGNTQFLLNICFNYGGKWDIVQAAQKIIDSGQPLTPHTLESALTTAHCGNPDLIIRTGGEVRLSNFLLWQAAYAELYFSEQLWPDFDERSLDAAIEAFQLRERRFGKTSEQLEVVSASKTLS